MASWQKQTKANRLVKDGLHRNHARDTDGQKLSEEIGCPCSDAESDQDQEHVEKYDYRNTHQPPLFSDHREDEIGMGLWKKAKLLAALPKSPADYSSRPESQKGLIYLVTCSHRTN